MWVQAGQRMHGPSVWCLEFMEREVCEKYLANWKDVFWAFMNSEKAYNTIDRHGMCQKSVWIWKKNENC